MVGEFVGGGAQVPGGVFSFRSTSCPSIESSSLRVLGSHTNPAIEKYHRIIKQQLKISRVAYHVEDKDTSKLTLKAWINTINVTQFT